MINQSTSGEAWNRALDPGLQGIELIHYNTEASRHRLLET